MAGSQSADKSSAFSLRRLIKKALSPKRLLQNMITSMVGHVMLWVILIPLWSAALLTAGSSSELLRDLGAILAVTLTAVTFGALLATRSLLKGGAIVAYAKVKGLLLAGGISFLVLAKTLNDAGPVGGSIIYGAFAGALIAFIGSTLFVLWFRRKYRGEVDDFPWWITRTAHVVIPPIGAFVALGLDAFIH